MDKKIDLQTSFRSFIDIDCCNNKQCQDYLEEFSDMKDKQKDKVSKALVLKATEALLVEDFLTENDIKFGTLVMTLLYRDGAMSDELIAAYIKSVRGAHKFLNNYTFTFEYKNNYKDMHWDTTFNQDKNKLKNLNIKYVLDTHIKEHYINKGFVSFTQYVKALFNNLGIYPDEAYQAIKKHIRTDFVLNPDQKHLKDLESDRKRQLSRRTKKIIKEDDQKTYHQINFTIKVFERTQILDPFVKYLKENKLSLSILARYELLQNKLISVDEASIKKEEIKKILELNFQSTAQGTNKFYYENGLAMEQKKATSIIFIPNSAKLIASLKGKSGTWIRYFVLKKYGAYPKINGTDISHLFINYNKISTFIPKA